MIENILAKIMLCLTFFSSVMIIVLVFLMVNTLLRQHWQNNMNVQFRFQLIMLVLTFIGGLIMIAALPISPTLLGQLLNLVGIFLSIMIALSSTTFIGNILAGIMLKVIKRVNSGDFITVEYITGRVTDVGLLHTKVQTEDRDLITVPNLYMVSKPMKVVRTSGAIISPRCL
ncbi:MAG: small-conductance mechanosensitive channel [Cellvibrionaceae bacterium]|jgi:small-conductance mechanosensitive channel